MLNVDKTLEGAEVSAMEIIREKLFNGSIERFEGTRAAYHHELVGDLGVAAIHGEVQLNIPKLTKRERYQASVDLGVFAGNTAGYLLELSSIQRSSEKQSDFILGA